MVLASRRTAVGLTDIGAAARARLVDPAPPDRSGQGYEHVDDPAFVRRAGMPGVLGGRPRRASLGRPGWLLPGVRPEGARQPGPRGIRPRAARRGHRPRPAARA